MQCIISYKNTGFMEFGYFAFRLHTGNIFEVNFSRYKKVTILTRISWWGWHAVCSKYRYMVGGTVSLLQAKMSHLNHAMHYGNV